MKKLFLSFALFIGASLNGAAQPTLLDKKLLGYVEPQEFKRGTHTTLIQIPVLEQSKESAEKGSSSHSSIYHALRNGIALAQALIEPKKAVDHLSKLYDREDMHQKLSYNGPWRNLIRTHRNGGNFTDKLSLDELEGLLDEERNKGTLAGKGISVASFEYANPDEPHEKVFEKSYVTDNLQALKRKLSAKEDLIGLIVVYTQTHDAKDPLLKSSSEDCGVCYEEKVVTRKTPCCKQMIFCDNCWQKIVIGNENQEDPACTHLCPQCRREYPGELKGEIKKLATDMPLEGHFVSIVVAQKGHKRQYFLLDSAAEHGRFIKNKPIKRLLSYLEGTDTHTELLPKFISDDPKLSADVVWKLKECFEDYKDSYKKTVPVAVKKQASFELKSFAFGILGTIGLYGCYYYFQKQNPAPQKGTENVTVAP